MIWQKWDVINSIRSCCCATISGQVLAEDVVDTTTGEILATAGTEVTKELADDIQNAAVPYVWIQGEERNIKCFPV